MNPKISMKAIILAAIAGATIGAAHAQGLTRDQVRAELDEARRNGTLSIGGEANLRLRDLAPGMYPAPQGVAGRSRQEVRAELGESIRSGDMVRAGEMGLTAYEMAPHLYPARPVFAGNSREEVRAVLAEAIRTGDIVVIGESGLTEAQQFPHVVAARIGRDAQFAVGSGVGPVASK
jgi:hypothetical protein